MLCKVLTVNMQTVELLEPADSELLFKSIQLEEYPARQKTPPDWFTSLCVCLSIS